MTTPIHSPIHNKVHQPMQVGSGKALLIVVTGPRGVVSTASCEACPYGVGSAMPMALARRRSRKPALAAPDDGHRRPPRVGAEACIAVAFILVTLPVRVGRRLQRRALRRSPLRWLGAAARQRRVRVAHDAGRLLVRPSAGEPAGQPGEDAGRLSRHPSWLPGRTKPHTRASFAARWTRPVSGTRRKRSKDRPRYRLTFHWIQPLPSGPLLIGQG